MSEEESHSSESSKLRKWCCSFGLDVGRGNWLRRKENDLTFRPVKAEMPARPGFGNFYNWDIEGSKKNIGKAKEQNIIY